MLYANFCRSINILGASAKLAIQSHLEYRLNFFIDACVQPLITAGIELSMWYTIFGYLKSDQLGGFSKDNYLAYMLWASFFSRVASNWYYEFRMVEEIESGSVNSILTRPLTFFEYYCGQFMGYKLLTAIFSFLIPFAFSLLFQFKIIYERLPMAILLMVYYLLFLYVISFLVSSLAFFFTRVASFTVTKNFLLWILSGEIFPLDILPQAIKSTVIALPFASSVYVPVGYLTGRLEYLAVANAFQSVSWGLLIVSLLASVLWLRGVRQYSGTGA
jgi:ABC-2 type transport system permease protein